MTDIINNGDAELVPTTCKASNHQWYIPHFGVYHPKKNKIRVVFDCAAKFKDTSLNDHLIQGPDFMNNLVGVLHRFRKGHIAVMCDIQKMFHMFKVHESDRDYLRFLWFKDETMTDIAEYRMTVHLFGAKSSPACATYGLRTLARDHGDLGTDSDKQAVNFIENDFYVDDGLMSLDSREQIVSVIKSAIDICAKGNVRLHKFVSNDQAVLATIPESEHAETMKDLNLNTDMPVERVLGVHWCIKNDEFQFKASMKEKPHTRRGVLSTIASVFDPLGFFSPVILIGKNILQEMCKDKADWDDALKPELEKSWVTWQKELAELPQIKIPRCLKPKSLSTIRLTELHHFCDASNNGLGQCTYLRLVDVKSRVASIKPITMPRAELMAAVLSSKMSTVVTTELAMPITNEYFWTDSKVVLGYVHNTTKKFQPFVANRVQQILSKSKATQWNYINTSINPADIASRGASIKKLLSTDWFKGPKFLWQPDLSHMLNADSNYEINSSDPEVKLCLQTNTEPQSKCSLQQHLSRFSDLKNAIKAVSAVKRLVKHKGSITPRLTINDLTNAKYLIMQWVQKESFSGEYCRLSEDKCVSKDSKLAKLDPFLDKHGLIRVGGRLRDSQLNYNEKHPIMLPSNSHLTKLVIKQCHEKVAHQGKNLTISEIKSTGYYIVIGVSRVLSSYIHQCITCRKQRNAPMTQKMADLPVEKVEPAPPFTYVGCDVFGPFIVKDRRAELKKIRSNIYMHGLTGNSLGNIR